MDMELISIQYIPASVALSPVDIINWGWIKVHFTYNTADCLDAP